MKNVIVVPTYNEKENIEPLIHDVFKHVPEIWLTVVDDNSPDGTAGIVKNLMDKYPHLRLIQREKKEGLGKAYTYAFHQVLKDGDVRSIGMMDADLSHPASALPEMVRQSETYSVVVGSRYVKGGGIVGWELRRKILSFFGNLYCRLITFLPVKDCTGGFNLIRADVLRKVPLDIMDSSGYAYIMELKFLLRSAGATFKEVPITFTNRIGGESKITHHIVQEGIIAPWKMMIGKYQQIIKYIVSGGTAAAVDIGFLVLFTEVFGWWYITSAIVAFLIAFGVSFTLQKFWTFKDKTTDNMHAQLSLYLLVGVINLLINSALMYFFVDIVGMWYVAAQVLTGGLIAVMSFFVYKKLIFKKA